MLLPARGNKVSLNEMCPSEHDMLPHVWVVPVEMQPTHAFLRFSEGIIRKFVNLRETI
jgi:hypothetical protein